MKRLCRMLFAVVLLWPGWVRAEAIREIDCSPLSTGEPSPMTLGRIKGSRGSPLPAETEIHFNMRSDGPNDTTAEEILILPGVAVALDNGWLVALDYGEWGGALKFKSPESEQEILSANVKDIFRMDIGYVAVTGLGHLGIDEGALYLVRHEAGGFASEKLFELPGEPERAFELEDGLLVVLSKPLGTYVLQRDGALRKARCGSESPAAKEALHPVGYVRR